MILVGRKGPMREVKAVTKIYANRYLSSVNQYYIGILLEVVDSHGLHLTRIQSVQIDFSKQIFGRSPAEIGDGCHQACTP